MDYEEKIMLLNEEDFVVLFSRLNAAPRWVTSAGKRALQLIGHCHHGDNHSALFDPSTLKVHCFSECGRGMHLHTWIKQALNMDQAYEAKEFIEDWIDNQDIDFSHRVPMSGVDFDYKERPYVPDNVPMIEGIPPEIIQELYCNFDTSLNTLSKLVWCKEDLIDTQLLHDFDVAYYPEKGTIILPHHNAIGQIVGLYERSFKPLRKDVQKLFPEVEYKKLLTYPRAKYVPLLKEEKYQTEEKTSWSFPNSFNLYGLHKAKEHIQKTGIAIVFEGAKSVMLARQYGFPFGVATHTFGIHLNHISMLIECGAKEIILAFDKQYEQEGGQAWDLYEHKTNTIAEKVDGFARISRLIDRKGLIGFKDSPIDKGFDIFNTLYNNREVLSKPIASDIPVNKPKKIDNIFGEEDAINELRKQLLREEANKRILKAL